MTVVATAACAPIAVEDLTQDPEKCLVGLLPDPLGLLLLALAGPPVKAGLTVKLGSQGQTIYAYCVGVNTFVVGS